MRGNEASDRFAPANILHSFRSLKRIGPVRWWLLFGLPFLASAQGSDEAQQGLALRPPHNSIPPTFWEAYGPVVIIGLSILVVLAAAVMWGLIRARPPARVPPEIRARRTLEALLRQPETDVTVSRANRALRLYVAEAFGLASGELTTAEFCRLSEDHEGIGPELGTALREYFRECDERKFAPAELPPTFGHVARAMQLFETAEARRRLIGLATQSTPAASSSRG